jgi:hypothetical protein
VLTVSRSIYFTDRQDDNVRAQTRVAAPQSRSERCSGRISGPWRRGAGESGAVGRVLRISGDDSDGPSKGDASESAAADGRLNTCLISGSFQYPRLPLTA